MQQQLERWTVANNDNVLGERLKKLRKDMDLGQEDIVEALRKRQIEIRQSHISNMENGTRLPSFQVLKALADVYETSTDYLLGITDNALSARDMEHELLTGGVSGRIGQLMASMSDRSRNDLLALAELLVQREMMHMVLRKVGELGGDAALHEMIDILESLWPGSSRWFFNDDSRWLLPPDKPV